jgi:hypothetical protein
MVLQQYKKWKRKEPKDLTRAIYPGLNERTILITQVEILSLINLEIDTWATNGQISATI